MRRLHKVAMGLAGALLVLGGSLHAATPQPTNAMTTSQKQSANKEVQTAFIWPFNYRANNCRPVVYNRPVSYVQPVSNCRPVVPAVNYRPIGYPAPSPCNSPCAPSPCSVGQCSTPCSQCGYGAGYGSPGGLVQPGVGGVQYQGINYNLQNVPGSYPAPASAFPVVPVNYQQQNGGVICPQCGVPHAQPHQGYPVAAPAVLPTRTPLVWPVQYQPGYQPGQYPVVPTQPFWTGEQAPSQLNVDKPAEPKRDYDRNNITVTDSRTRPTSFQRANTGRAVTPFYP